jgi:hypothetical protein
MKQMTVILAMMLLLLSCGGRKQLSPEELSHKLDSVKNLEINEKLQLQGINLEESDNPLKQFYDSLNLQTLPISYTEDYVTYLPGFRKVPEELVSYLNFEGHHPKAISLPESLGARMILLAADENEKDEHKYSLWLYSLDEDYIPVDKLCLYALEDEEDLIDIDPEEFIQYFSITSDYEIHLLDYSKTARKTCTEEVYYLDSSRHFVLQESESTN